MNVSPQASSVPDSRQVGDAVHSHTRGKIPLSCPFHSQPATLIIIRAFPEDLMLSVNTQLR